MRVLCLVLPTLFLSLTAHGGDRVVEFDQVTLTAQGDWLVVEHHLDPVAWKTLSTGDPRLIIRIQEPVQGVRVDLNYTVPLIARDAQTSLPLPRAMRVTNAVLEVDGRAGRDRLTGLVVDRSGGASLRLPVAQQARPPATSPITPGTPAPPARPAPPTRPPAPQRPPAPVCNRPAVPPIIEACGDAMIGSSDTNACIALAKDACFETVDLVAACDEATPISSDKLECLTHAVAAPTPMVRAIEACGDAFTTGDVPRCVAKAITYNRPAATTIEACDDAMPFSRDKLSCIDAAAGFRGDAVPIIASCDAAATTGRDILTCMGQAMQ